MAISPEGQKIGAIMRTDGAEALLTFDFDEKQWRGGVRLSDIKARDVEFIGNDHIILRASETTSLYGFRGQLEYSAAFAFNLETERIRQLLRDTEGLFPAQSGLGRILGTFDNARGRPDVFMPAFMGSRSSDPSYSLLRVNLDSGRGRVFKRGTPDTRDWFVDRDGTVLAEERFDDNRNVYSIRALQDGKLKEIYSHKASIPPIALVGVKPDKSALIISRYSKDDYIVLAEMDFKGNFSPPIFSRADADVERVILGENQVVYGVEYAGMYPSYEFFDPELNSLMQSVVELLPESAVSLTDWTDDFAHLVVHIAGNKLAPAYYRFDRAQKKLVKLQRTHNAINDEDVAEVLSIEYKTRDGAVIPAVLTRPRDWSGDRLYPTIILPHGGPEAHDSVGFDWMAQFFASRGYLVLQPNFRGSDGFGDAFKQAGRGEWGKGVMQHDVTDGLKALIRSKWADPEKVCIIGASYGGYAALAGGAFTPDLYACIGAIAPVASLPRMLIDERRDSGRNSWVVDYWTDLIGDPKSEREKLKSISPSEHASEFQAPVLLIHGNDDTVVPFHQSRMMEGALKRANKSVRFVKLKGGDHWLSTGETRLETLKALSVFVEENIGPGVTTQ